MLLNELNLKQLEPKKSNDPAQAKFNILSKTTDYSTNKEPLGFGAFATAHSTKQEPGTATKVVEPTQDLKRDGYFQYVKMLASHKEGTNNRYFPKIYNVEVFEDSSGTYTYSVDMERLHKFTDLSTEELLTIGNHIFSNFDQMIQHWNRTRQENRRKDKFHRQGMLNARKHHKAYKVQEDNKYEYVSQALLSGVSNAIKSGSSDIATNIKDSEFKRATMMIRGLIMRSHQDDWSYEWIVADIHQGNIMVRRGPFMPQLVITDPLV